MTGWNKFRDNCLDLKPFDLCLLNLGLKSTVLNIKKYIYYCILVTC